MGCLGLRYSLSEMVQGSYGPSAAVSPGIADKAKVCRVRQNRHGGAAVLRYHAQRRSCIPVPYEQFSREWMGVASQDNFDGFRLEATKQVCMRPRSVPPAYSGANAQLSSSAENLLRT